MSVIEKNYKASVQTPHIKRMIKCPGHWLVSPTVDVYLREPVPLLKNASNFVYIKGHRIDIKKTRIKRDRFGRKMLDWKKLYALEKTGKVIQPLLTAAEAIEKVYDPKGRLCMNCDKRCKRGQGKVNEMGIRRLNG